MARIIYGMPEGRYYGDKTRWSASLLKSAAYNGISGAKAMLDGKDIDNKAMQEGRLAHLRVCCPDEWHKLVTYPPEDLKEGVLDTRGNPPKSPMQTKEYKAKVELWKKKHPDKIHVTKAQYDKANQYYQALVQSPCFSEPTEHEIVVHFKFNEKEYKCRVDAERNLGNGSYDLYDWKFIGGRTGTEDFYDKVFDYNYHMQAALYRLAYQQAGRKVRKFFMVGVDKRTCDPSHTVCIDMPEADLETGLRDCDYWHRRIEYAIVMDDWTE